MVFHKFGKDGVFVVMAAAIMLITLTIALSIYAKVSTN
jgi:hypothetical protein